MSAHGTDEEGSLRGGHYVDPKGHHQKDRRGHHRSHSKDHFRPQKGNQREHPELRHSKSVDSCVIATNKKTIGSSKDSNLSKGSEKTSEEERKINFFSRNRSRSGTETSMTIPFRRGTTKEKTNNEPRRRSLIERITQRSNSEEKEENRRRSLIETRTLFANAKKSLESNNSFQDQAESFLANPPFASEISNDGSTEVMIRENIVCCCLVY